MPLREHFASYARQAGRRLKEDIDIPEPPAAVMHLWWWFHQITRGRPIAGTGHYLPIPSSEILAWCTLARVRLEDWELAVIRDLDGAFLKVMAEKDG